MSLISLHNKINFAPTNIEPLEDMPLEVAETRESILAQKILIAALAAKEEAGNTLIPGETLQIPITETIADPEEVKALGDTALRTAMAMHHDSHDLLLVHIDSNDSGETANFQCL